MRQNKLTKFCDLITSQEPEVRLLNDQLNQLNQFTLFVPTNEALLLMPTGHLEEIKRKPEVLKEFLSAHATDELVIPRQSMESSLFTTLSGGQLRVVTTSTTTNQTRTDHHHHHQQQQQQQQVSAASKLELIVNGANVVNGNSYALQEPNNNNVTYAIVHLLDRVLYPLPSGRLLDKVRLLAPRMAAYFELANEPQLNEALEQQYGGLTTLFLPNDDAFKASSSKLIDQLDTNRTFLIEFLRAHLSHGLYFVNQLALSASSQSSSNIERPNSVFKLSSYSGKVLEIETKLLQARTLVLVNSIPLIEPTDIMTLNGVIHTIARPIFESHLVEDCNCEPTTTTTLASNNNKLNQTQPNSRVWPQNVLLKKPDSSFVTYVFDNRATNWFYSNRKPAASSAAETNESVYDPLGSNELEREESQQVNSQRVRSQRSGNLLVGRNNRDFYRPSISPTNNEQGQQKTPIGNLIPKNERRNDNLQDPSSSLDMNNNREPLFEVDKYKVVLNATTRQRLRQEMQSLENGTSNRFVYDRPILTSTTESSNNQLIAVTPSTFLKIPYLSSLTQRDSNLSLLNPNQDQLTSSSNSQKQQMIKFQPEDARDPLFNRASNSFARNSLLDTLQDRQRLASKSVVSGSNSDTKTGCAFYDADCRRVLGRLVRLPPTKTRSDQQRQVASSNLMQASGSNHSSIRTNSQHLDSTFGETDQQVNSNNNNNNNNTGTNQQVSKRPNTAPNRVSPLIQPLPPWNEAEHKLINWYRGPDEAAVGDISRIKGLTGHGFTGGLSRSINTISGNITSQRQTKQSQPHMTTTEILLVPIKIIHEPIIAAQVNLTAPSSTNRQRFAPESQNTPINQQGSGIIFSGNNKQFHTPTPYSVSMATTHIPPMFNSHPLNHLGRLTNFTAFETIPSPGPTRDINDRDSSVQSQAQLPLTRQPKVGAKQSRVEALVQSSIPKAPSSFRKQRLQQVQIDSNGSLVSNIDESTELKQAARKSVRVQQDNLRSTLVADEFTGDMSITSARLTNFTFNPSSPMATQASNVSANFIRSVPASELQSGSSNTGNDFFQDRTIAEIMDDSGLRIDGQQVTFNRLKECLTEAELLSLVTQTGNSLSIFMPTDLAFQRLVQQQALSHQKQREQSRSSSSRLTLPSSQLPLPLLVRASRQMQTNNNRDQISSSTNNEFSSSSSIIGDQFNGVSNAGDRLTLDCSSNQVRKLLLDHLSAGLITPKQLQNDMIISALSGRKLLLSSVPSKKIVVVDGQPVIAATRAKNGMVYVVNKFLNLTQQAPNVVDLMETQANLTTFLSYLTFSSLSDRLKRETGPLTILAPTNEAFEQLSKSARQLMNSDPSALADILRGHIIDGAQFGKLIPMRNQLKTMNSDQLIEAKVIKPNVYQLDNQMTSMRLVGTTGNGVVNSIDRLIVPAWLKVSMGAKPGVSTTTATGSGTRSTSANNNNNLNLNLPTISNQPLRFEQPGNRLNAPSGRDSFLLAERDLPPTDINNNNNNNNNNNLLDFDLLSSPPAQLDPISSAGQRSPFVRLANTNLTVTSSLSSRLDQTNTRQTPKNITKNMQLIDKLSNLMQANKFVKYLFNSGVSESLKPDMNYVILVPTDQAIDKLPKQIIDLLDRDKERLADLVNYHILDTTFEFINTIPDGQTLNTLNEKDILFNWHRNNTILTASGAVVMGGIQEDNIALLVVDRVLYPTPGDILNIISKSPILSNFTSIIKSAGLEKQLSLAGPYTLFAPSDFAFNQLDQNDMQLLRRNKETARRFLLRHLSQPAVFTSSIALSNNRDNSTTEPATATTTNRQLPVPQMTITNSLGEDLMLRQRNDYFSVNEVNFSYADVAATNGVVHVIDGLL